MNQRGEYGRRSHARSRIGADGIMTFVSPAHAAAMATLNSAPILGVPARDYSKENISSQERRYLENSANARLTDIVNALGPERPGSGKAANGGYPLRRFAPTAGDAVELATRFLSAVSAGVEREGYDVSNYKDPRAHKNVIRNILARDYTTDRGFTPLGSAAVEVMRGKTLALTPQWDADAAGNRTRLMRALGDLVLEMDAQGLHIEGAPKPEPTVWGGITHAVKETARWAGRVPGEIGGAAAGAVSALGTGAKIALFGGAAALGIFAVSALVKKSSRS